MNIKQLIIGFVAVAVLSATASASTHNWRDNGPAPGWTMSSSTTTNGPGQAPYNPVKTRTVTVWKNDTGIPQNVVITLSAFQCSFWSASIEDRYFESYPSGSVLLGYYYAGTYAFTVASGDTVKVESVTETGQWYDGDSYISDSSAEFSEMHTTTSANAETWAPFDEMTRDWYDAGGWSPDPSTVPNGLDFTQSKNQQQDWRRGERSNLGNERNVSTYTVSRIITQTATGTKQKTAPVITWSTPSAITYGTRLGAGQLNATANTTGVYSYSPAEYTALNAGADQVLEVTFTPDDAANYNTATATQTITVNKAPTTLTITSPTASPHTLPVDSTATISTNLRRGSTALSTASVSYAIGTATGTAAGTLIGNQFTMTAGAGSDTVAVTASYPGDANHLPSTASVIFRVPIPGSVVFGYPIPVASPVTLPDAFLFAEHGPTTSTFDFVLHNPGELPVEVTSADITPALGSVTSFQIVDAGGGDAAAPFTIPAGASRALKILFHPVRYALNSDTITFTWQCRPGTTVLASGSTVWTLQGQGLKPIMATLPRGSLGDPDNPRDLQGTWPTLKTK